MRSSASPKVHSKWTRVLRWAGYVLLALVVLVGGALLSLRTQVVRNLIRGQANSALASVFRGKVQVDRVGSVGLMGVSGVDARVFDAAGRQVIYAQELRARLSVLGLVKQLLGSGDTRQIRIANVEAVSVQVNLFEDADSLSIASAFQPLDQAEETPSNTVTEVYIEGVQLRHVWVAGSIKGLLIDADVDALTADLAAKREGVVLTLKHADVRGRALPYAADPILAVDGVLQVPAKPESPISINAKAAGTLAAAPLQAQVALEGDAIDGWVHLAGIPAAAVNSRVSGLALRSESTLNAVVSGSLSALQINADLNNADATVDIWLDVESGVATDLDVDAVVSSANLAGIVANGPQSKIDLRLDAQLRLEGSSVSGVQHLEVAPSLLEGQRTPAISGVGWLNSDPAGTVLDGALSIVDPGINAQTTYRVAVPVAAPTSVQAQLQAKLNNPSRLKTLDVRMGRGQVSAKGQWQSNGQVSLTADGAIDRIEYNDLLLGRTKLAASIKGSVDSPQGTARVAFRVAGGQVEAKGSFSQAQQQAQLLVKNVELAVLGKQLGANLPVDAGHVDLSLDVSRKQEKLSGLLDLSARGLHTPDVGRGNVQAKLALAEQRVVGEIQASLGAIGNVDVTIKTLQVPRTLDARSLRAVTGAVNARGNVNLTEATPLMARLSLPVEELGGFVNFDVSAERAVGVKGVPNVALKLNTRELRVIGKRDKQAQIASAEVAKTNKPFALEGIDLDLASEFDPEQSELAVKLSAKDRQSQLFALDATAQLPHGNAAYQAVGSFETLPIKATLRVPERRMGSLPALIRPSLRGRLSAVAEFEGTVLEPKVKARVAVRSLRSTTKGSKLDVQSDVQFAPQGGEVTVVALETGVPAASLKGSWQGDVRKLGEMTETSSPVQARIEGSLRDFPLQVIQVLADQQVTGRMSGDIKLLDWGKDAHAELALSGNGLRVGQIPIKTLKLSAKQQADQATSQLLIELQEGRTEASIQSEMLWGARPLPILGKKVQGRLTAKDFELGTLQPLLVRSVSEIGGKLNANATLNVANGATEVTGGVEVKQGVLQVPAIGQRFTGIVARVAIAKNELKLENLEAAGSTGRLHGSGSVNLRGVEVARAQMEVKIAKDEKIPVTLEGAAIGDAWGTVRAKYQAERNAGPELVIDVPQFQVNTPDTGGYDLQAMDPNSDVRVGVQRKDGQFAALPIQPLEPDTDADDTKAKKGPPLKVTVKLGDVTVQRGSIATAQLTGELVIVTADPVRVNGRIELKGGKIDVQGKTFEVESGVVTFQGREASNPTITATARWESPTDHVVYANYAGDVQNGRVKLHSEPPLSQDQIASLLLFGTPDGTFGSGDTDNASLAVSVAGGTVAKGLNRALSNFTNLDVSARVDTSTGSSRPELVFQVTPRLAAKVSRAVGAPTAGESPDRTFLTLELRLQRTWALSAVVGDRGATALDLIWRRRY